MRKPSRYNWIFVKPYAVSFPEVQRNLEDYIATRRAMKKAKSGEDRVSLGRAGDALCSLERVRKLAGKIYRQFEREQNGEP